MSGFPVTLPSSQVDKVADKGSYMDVCGHLRKAQDEEVALSTQLQVRGGGGRCWSYMIST